MNELDVFANSMLCVLKAMKEQVEAEQARHANNTLFVGQCLTRIATLLNVESAIRGGLRDVYHFREGVKRASFTGPEQPPAECLGPREYNSVPLPYTPSLMNPGPAEFYATNDRDDDMA